MKNSHWYNSTPQLKNNFICDFYEYTRMNKSTIYLQPYSVVWCGRNVNKTAVLSVSCQDIPQYVVRDDRRWWCCNFIKDVFLKCNPCPVDLLMCLFVFFLSGTNLDQRIQPGTLLAKPRPSGDTFCPCQHPQHSCTQQCDCPGAGEGSLQLWAVLCGVYCNPHPECDGPV